MRDRITGALRALRGVRTPEVSPASWVVLLFLGTILGDGLRSRAARGPIPAGDANLLAVLVIVAFVALVLLVATVVETLRDR